jgi:hypothetical protein
MTPLGTCSAVALGLVLLVRAPLGVAAPPVALDAYVALRRALEAAPDAAQRERLEGQAEAAREILLAAARAGSRLLVMMDRRGGADAAPLLETARLVARDGRITLQALSGPRPQSPHWERAGLVAPADYLAVMDRLLRDPALVADWPAPRLDPNAPGPRRAVVVRLAIGEDEQDMQAVAGPGYERLAGLAAGLLEFCRTVPLEPAR